MIRVCYIQHASEYPLIKQVAEFLKKDDIEVIFVVKKREAINQYEEAGFETYFISEIIDKKYNLSKEEVLAIDLKYGPHGIRSICNSDIYLKYLFKKQTDREQFVARAYKFWEDFLDNHKIDYLLVRETASFATRTAYNIARFRGCPSVGTIQISPGPERFPVCDVGEEYTWSEFLEKIADGPKPLDESQKKIVWDFINKITEGRSGPVRMPYLSSISPLSFFRSLVGAWKRDTESTLLFDPIKVASLRFGIHRLMKRAKWKYITQHFFPYDKAEDENYVYLPLHYEDEAMNLANYHYWTQNQLSLVKEVSSSLPVGFKVYVKEHPRLPGEFSWSFLRNLRRISNVKVINPLVNGQKMIEGSKAVIVLDGTSGWEAYLRHKPAIALGSLIYFAYSKIIYKIKSPYELPVTLFNAIKKGSEIYKENKEEWLWFIHCVVSTCGEGILMGAKPPYFFGDPENSKKVADFIAKKIKRSVKKR
jgi:hypothetical protein